jgi:uncharacterized protein (DUF58 family)
MISLELTRQLRRLQIATRRTVDESLAGQYQSVFKGQGIEFDTVREYQPGDDVRSIDWNVTARMGHPFVKRFVEERELTVMLLVDLSASGAFGSQHHLKNEAAAEVGALLILAAVRNHDKVGLILFTDGVERCRPPAHGLSHGLRLIRDMLQFKPRSIRTNITAAIDYLNRATTRRVIVFLVSDFRATDFVQPLRALARCHDVIAISLIDPREAQMPNVGLAELEDAETGEVIQLDTGSVTVRQVYAQQGARRLKCLRDLFRSLAIDQIEMITGCDYGLVLGRFFRARHRRMHG